MGLTGKMAGLMPVSLPCAANAVLTIQKVIIKPSMTTKDLSFIETTSMNKDRR
jgi:hypothetical protein